MTTATFTPIQRAIRFFCRYSYLQSHLSDFGGNKWNRKVKTKDLIDPLVSQVSLDDLKAELIKAGYISKSSTKSTWIATELAVSHGYYFQNP